MVLPKKQDTRAVFRIEHHVYSEVVKEVKEMSKEEKHDIGVFICVVCVWLGITITGVF